MWATPYLSERIAQDRIQANLRELERRQLIREALKARSARGIRTPTSSVLGLLRMLRLRPYRLLKTANTTNHAIQ